MADLKSTEIMIECISCNLEYIFFLCVILIINTNQHSIESINFQPLTKQIN